MLEGSFGVRINELEEKTLWSESAIFETGRGFLFVCLFWWSTYDNRSAFLRRKISLLKIKIEKPSIECEVSYAYESNIYFPSNHFLYIFIFTLPYSDGNTLCFHPDSVKFCSKVRRLFSPNSSVESFKSFLYTLHDHPSFAHLPAQLFLCWSITLTCYFLENKLFSFLSSSLFFPHFLIYCLSWASYMLQEKNSELSVGTLHSF